MNPFSYSNNDPHFNLNLKKSTKKWVHYTVDFPTAHPTQHEENNTARGEYFQPRGVDNAPLAILLHGMGDYSVTPCKFLARALAKRGIACFILYLVFHSSRMPQVVQDRLPNLTSEEWFDAYRSSVIEVRQAIDWASDKAEINHKQIAVIGISLGGFISSIAMGVDKRIGAGVFLVTGGNAEVITWKSRANNFRKGDHCTEEECHRIHEYYPQYLADVIEKGFENVIPLKQCFLTDTMTFAHCLQKRPILMINALWDKYIPKQATLEFWEASGKPDISWFPATHITIWLWYPFISRKIAAFLNQNFGAGIKDSA